VVEDERYDCLTNLLCPRAMPQVKLPVLLSGEPKTQWAVRDKHAFGGVMSL
jgi:hypothetical protein